MTDYATHHFKVASDFTVSVGYDRRLAPFDIDASIAHARMLGTQGIIPAADADAIVRGLAALRAEAERGDFPWRDEIEDVHMNLERRLAEVIGEPAARLHTARSRNDQV
ncbi:MAG: lyase family protein, partial [Chloroflexota bacterium]|nr:lyase family protein [Chloroflexota bacterium]